MGNVFSICFTNTAVSTAKTLLWINPGVSRPIRIIELGMSQSGSTTSAIQRVQAVRQVSAFPTLTSFTPRALTNDATSVIIGGTAGAAGTCGIADVATGAEGAGAKTVLWEDDWNVVNGSWRWVGGPKGIVLPASSSSGFGLYIPATAGGGSITYSAYLHFEEVD